jgi:hypothetical protein
VEPTGFRAGRGEGGANPPLSRNCNSAFASRSQAPRFAGAGSLRGKAWVISVALPSPLSYSWQGASLCAKLLPTEGTANTWR